jgi:hypothetical protein
VNHVQGDTELDGCAQSIRTDQVATMNDSLRPGCLCFGNSRCERLRTIMTVGNDADFHYVDALQKCLLLTVNQSIMTFSVFSLNPLCDFSVYTYNGVALL